MVFKLLEETGDEPIQPVGVPIALRLAGCAVACLIAFIPAITATYASSRVVSFFRGMNAETVPSAVVLVSTIRSFNQPLVIGLGVSAILALGLALVLASNPRLRLASVGLPCSIALLFMAAGPALVLWNAESLVLDIVVYNKVTNKNDLTASVMTISNLLFYALLLGLIAVPASFVAPLVSLLFPLQSRSDPLSAQRVMIWLLGAVLLLAFSGMYFILG